MKSVYRFLMQACYVLGFFTLIMGILLRHIPRLYAMLQYGPTGVFNVAGVLFLGSLASFAMLRLEAK